MFQPDQEIQADKKTIFSWKTEQLGGQAAYNAVQQEHTSLQRVLHKLECMHSNAVS